MSTTTHPPALPGLTPARRPYPGGTERHYPLVPDVLIIGERKGYYLPPPLIRAETVYDTPTTVRVRLPNGRQETQSDHKVYAVPDDAAWAAIEAAVAAFGQRLTDLANLLRRLGSYPARLAAAGGMKAAPNPLCERVACISDPDAKGGTNWGLSAWHVPSLERKPIARHTAKMLTAGGENPYFFTQDDSFVLADDADWDELEAAHQAAKAAAQDAQQLLEHTLGTYQDARDGRHNARVTPAAVPAAPPAEAKALVPAAPVVEAHLVLTRDEARVAADRIIAAVDNLRTLIDEFDQGEGWKALGYESFRAWAQAEIPDTSLRHVYRLRDAAEVDRSLGVPVGATPERHARELKSVEPERRADVLQKADARATEQGRERTADDVRQAAGRVTHGSQPEAAPSPLAAVAEQMGRGDTKAAYNAVHAVPMGLRDQAYAAVDALVDGKPLESALRFLEAAAVITGQHDDGQAKIPALRITGDLALTIPWMKPKPPEPGRLSATHYAVTYMPTGHMVGKPIEGRPAAERIFGELARLDWSLMRGAERMPRALAEAVARIFGMPLSPAPAEQAPPAPAPLPPEYAEWVERAHAAGCTLSRWQDGQYQLVEPDRQSFRSPAWIAVMARIRGHELATPAPPDAEESDAVPADARPIYDAADAAVRAELAAASPRLLRLLRAAWGAASGDPPPTAEEFVDELTGCLVACVDEDLAWALGEEAPPAPAAPEPAARWPHLDHPELDALSEELLGAELASDPPDAGDVARWQDTLDAHVVEISDETYERLAHRIGELRKRAEEGVPS